MLYLIGLGLTLEDLSIKALNTIKKCQKIYLENYTTTFPYKIQDLEKLIKKKVELATRELVENDLYEILKETKKSNIALLVYGDPLAATTHITILKEAKKSKIKTEVIHNVSILNAISETGLQLYRFGKVTSLPKWQKNYEPQSFMNIIKENLSINAHTLLLIDPGLSLKESLQELEQSDEQGILKDKELIVASKLGTKDQRIKKIKNLKEKIEEPFCIIIPANLSFGEEIFIS